MKMTAEIMVILSRFFSIMLVPETFEYTCPAIMSERPVPLDECMRMEPTITRADTSQKTRTITSTTDTITP